MTKRTVTLKGSPVTLEGPALIVGSPVPDFTVRRGLTPDSGYTLATDAGKTRLLSIVPSLDRPVCSLQTQRLNQEAGKLGDDVVVVTVSMDLPPAQERWRQDNSVENLITASDYFDHGFGPAMGMRIRKLGILARGIVILDGDGIVRYVQVVPELSEEPDYDDAIAAVKKIMAG